MPGPTPVAGEREGSGNDEMQVGLTRWKPQFSPNADLTVSSVIGARVNLVYHRLSILAAQSEQPVAGAMRAVRVRGKKKEHGNRARRIREERAS
uniref:Uncharacterized protein n=1 Tax=Setaria italica TaxID=4555 RepID=K3ZYG6_SETIT